MRIIGIDPGTICCGYGIVESCKSSGQKQHSSGLMHIASGEIKLKKNAPLPDRLKTVYDSLNSLIAQYSPTHLCLEKIFYHKSIPAAFTLGSVRGIALLLAAQNSLHVAEHNPTEIKMALTGYGRAEKRQVQEMVKRILGLDHSPRTEDSTDALALCICHINSLTYSSQISEKP